MAPGIILTIYFLYNDINTFNKTLLFCYFILYISVKSNTSLTSYIILNWLILMIVLQINTDNIYGLVSLYINVAVVVVVDQEVLISNCRNAVFRSKMKDEKKIDSEFYAEYNLNVCFVMKCSYLSCTLSATSFVAPLKSIIIFGFVFFCALLWPTQWKTVHSRFCGVDYHILDCNY